MTQPFGDSLTQLAFSIYENKGVYALLLGSGISRASEIPTGWEITKDLIRRVANSEGDTQSTDWAQWYHEKYGREPSYSEIVERLGGSPSERQKILESYIEPLQDNPDGKRLPTAGHKAIARLVKQGFIKVIITTNFDRLLEMALRDEGITPDVASNEDSINGAKALTHSSCYIFKVHGDYKDARIRNTEDELRTYPDAHNRLLERIFDEFGLIVCGWSGDWDEALRNAITRAPGRRYSTFWASRGKPSERAQDLIDHRSAKVVEIAGADGFFSEVAERVEALARSSQASPVTTDMLVARVKRYVARPEHRIELEDLIRSELETATAKIDAYEAVPKKDWTRPEAMRERALAFEAAMEPLVQMMGVLGRWDSKNDSNIGDCQIFCA